MSNLDSATPAILNNSKTEFTLTIVKIPNKISSSKAMATILSDRNNHSVIFCLSILVSLLAVSCNETKYTQCDQIIQFANSVVQEKTKLIDTNNSENMESKTWLQAARMITQAAQQIEAIPLRDPKLINYQANLAQIYRVYSQATYDAVKAWENKNIEALQTAHTDAERAGELEEKLGNSLNTYCEAQ